MVEKTSVEKELLEHPTIQMLGKAFGTPTILPSGDLDFLSQKSELPVLSMGLNTALRYYYADSIDIKDSDEEIVVKFFAAYMARTLDPLGTYTRDHPDWSISESGIGFVTEEMQRRLNENYDMLELTQEQYERYLSAMDEWAEKRRQKSEDHQKWLLERLEIQVTAVAKQIMQRFDNGEIFPEEALNQLAYTFVAWLPIDNSIGPELNIREFEVLAMAVGALLKNSPHKSEKNDLFSRIFLEEGYVRSALGSKAKAEKMQSFMRLVRHPNIGTLDSACQRAYERYTAGDLNRD